MIAGRCPTCKKPYEIAELRDLPTFPFCSERCRLLDLGRWIDGAYAIPGQEVRNPTGEDDKADDEDD